MQDTAFLYHFRIKPVSQSVLERYQRLLNAQELQAVGALKFPKHRDERLIARAMLRKALSHITGLNPSVWQFRKNRHGRPEIEAPSEYQSLRFNMSHAGGMVVCLVCFDRNVGVDVEPIGTIYGLRAIVDQHCARAEAVSILASPPHEQCERFLELWTLKEAYFKARGTGLAVSPRSATFFVDPDSPSGIQAVFAPELADEPLRWQFVLSRMSDHLVAAAIEKRSTIPVKMVLREAETIMANDITYSNDPP